MPCISIGYKWIFQVVLFWYRVAVETVLASFMIKIEFLV